MHPTRIKICGVSFFAEPRKTFWRTSTQTSPKSLSLLWLRTTLRSSQARQRACTHGLLLTMHSTAFHIHLVKVSDPTCFSAPSICHSQDFVVCVCVLCCVVLCCVCVIWVSQAYYFMLLLCTICVFPYTTCYPFPDKNKIKTESFNFTCTQSGHIFCK